MKNISARRELMLNGKILKTKRKGMNRESLAKKKSIQEEKLEQERPRRGKREKRWKILERKRTRSKIRNGNTKNER